MYCNLPKTFIITAIEHAKLKFRIDNDAVVILLVLLVFNILLYMFLLPCCVSIVNYNNCSNLYLCEFDFSVQFVPEK